MSGYRNEWPCCGDETYTDAWEPERCPFCELNETKDRISELETELEAASAQGEEPSGVWQFYQNGEWHVGMNSNNHRQNTEEAGIPVRDLYTHPQSTGVPEGFEVLKRPQPPKEQ